MKRCPECRRDYYDDSLLYCLEDGVALALIQGAVPGPLDEIGEPATAILHSGVNPSERTAVLPSAIADIKVRKPSNKLVWLAAAVFAAIAFGGFIAYRYLGGSSTAAITSIAVMPFANAGGNVDFDYLSDGISDVLIKNLSGIPNLNIKARSSVFRYKGRQADVKTVASELGVQTILNGRVVQLGDDITLSLELVECATENVLWTEQYVRKFGDLAKLQNEIARDVSNKLKAKLTAADETRLAKTYTTDPKAYQIYLKGQFLLNKATPESQKQSIEYFRQAVDIDPNFAQAYTSMADAYTILGTIFEAQMPAEEAMGNARAAAEKALQLNPELSDAHTSLAWIKFRFDWDWEAAEADFKKAIELDPKSAHAHQWYGEFLFSMGRREEGLAELRIARDIEPFSAIIVWNLGKNLVEVRRYDEALVELNRTLELDSNFSRSFRLTSMIYEEKGMTKEAFAAFLRQTEIARLPPERLSELRRIYETKGLTAARRRGVEWYLTQTTTPAQRALAYVLLDDKPAALEQLEKAFAERNGTLVALNTARSWDPLRKETAFQDLIRRMNFPKVLQ